MLNKSKVNIWQPMQWSFGGTVERTGLSIILYRTLGETIGVSKELEELIDVSFTCLHRQEYHIKANQKIASSIV